MAKFKVLVTSRYIHILSIYILDFYQESSIISTTWGSYKINCNDETNNNMVKTI
jgi:ATP/ADP translocase